MNLNSKHIVFLTPGFAASEKDSTTIPALQEYFKSLKHFLPFVKLTVLTFEFPFTNDRYKWNGIEIIPLNGQNSKLKKILVLRKAYKILQKLHTENSIDIIHSFWIGECSLTGQHFANKHNLKHIVTAMGQDTFKNKYALFLNKNQSKIVTLSKNHHDVLFKNYGIESKIIPWGINPESFPQLSENTIDILGVGSLNHVKNYPLFIEIINEILKTEPNIKVVIIGKGDQKKNIEKLIKEYELENNIILVGGLERNAVLEKMSVSNILLHTSTYESFGYVFSEALYSGMKIVSFDVGNFKEIPEWKIGSSKESFAKSLSCFLKTETKKKRILLATSEECVNMYINLYK